ncbi:hypothetical protein LZ30DRAFT_722355 [Colletotrichum cereale]|nr:hypothetical protein LZ30DRAFT_722355 [Colletotrichum cereale]
MSTILKLKYTTCADSVSRPLWQALHPRLGQYTRPPTFTSISPCWISPASFDLIRDQDGPIQNTMSPGPRHTPPSPYIARYSIDFLLDGGTPSITAWTEVLPLQAVVSRGRTNHTECFGPPRSILMGQAPDLAIGIRISLLDPLAGFVLAVAAWV